MLEPKYKYMAKLIKALRSKDPYAATYLETKTKQVLAGIEVDNFHICDYPDIDNLMTWDDTEQGHSYWSNLHSWAQDNGVYTYIHYGQD